MSELSTIDSSLFCIMERFHPTQLKVAFEFGYSKQEIIACLRLHYYHYKQVYYKNAGQLIAELYDFYNENKTEKNDVQLTDTDEKILCNRLKTLNIGKADCQRVDADDDDATCFTERLEEKSSLTMSEAQESLSSETRKLYIKTLCLSCLADSTKVNFNKRNAVTLPCMHYSMCIECIKKPKQRCVSCEEVISDYIRIFE